MRSIKAKKIHDFVVDTLASGEWPVSRAKLGGVRLRQVTNAIKISAAQIYCDELKGLLPKGRYESMKNSLGAMTVMITDVFIRDEDWERIQLIEDAEKRKVELISCGSTKSIDEEKMNGEEKEIYEDETFNAFSSYLEKLPNDYPYIMPHVLGHLSRRYIYTNDEIPIFKLNPIDKIDLQQP